ncbi:MAG: hypothetical protein MZV49_04530 [Rhodopseudomonas palustris]|nr:hypothetical protein [Rhodopseudomonas palustris]
MTADQQGPSMPAPGIRSLKAVGRHWLAAGVVAKTSMAGTSPAKTHDHFINRC